METINRFIGKYSFLNNFYESSIWIDGKRYKTCEHAYQAHKTLDECSKEIIRKSKTPLEAKKLGRALVLREDWEDVKVPLMRMFLKKKFENPFLRCMLLETGTAELIHENKWNDKFWGVSNGVGENFLGKLLMETRNDLLVESDEEDIHFLKVD